MFKVSVVHALFYTDSSRNCESQADQLMLDRILAECYAPTLLGRRVELEVVIELIGIFRQCYPAGSGWNVVVSSRTHRRNGGLAERNAAQAD